MMFNGAELVAAFSIFSHSRSSTGYIVKAGEVLAPVMVDVTSVIAFVCDCYGMYKPASARDHLPRNPCPILCQVYSIAILILKLS